MPWKLNNTNIVYHRYTRYLTDIDTLWFKPV